MGLKEEYKDILPEEVIDDALTKAKIASAKSGLPEDVVARNILNSLSKRYTTSNMNELYGVILSIQNPRNRSEKKIAECFRKYNEDPESAIQYGYVAVADIISKTKVKLSTSGGIETTPYTKDIPDSARQFGDKYVIPLDYVKTFPSGNRNPNYLKAIPAEDWATLIEGIVYHDDRYKKFTMWYNLKDPNDVIPIPVGVPVKFVASVRNTQGDAVTLGSKDGLTTFAKVDEGEVSLDDATIFREITLSEDIQDGQDVAVMGSVRNIWMSQNSSWKTVVLDEYETGSVIRLLYHPYLTLGFGEGDVIVGFGSTRVRPRIDRKTGEELDELETVVFATGYFALTSSFPEDIEDVNESDIGFGSGGEDW